MSVIRSYNLSNGQAINDAPAQIIRIFDSGVLIVNADSGAVTSVNGKTGIVVLAASDVGAATAAQGALADTAIQPGSLGTAAAAATSDFDPAGAAAAAQSAAVATAEAYTDSAVAGVSAPTWDDITGKPATFPPTIGTTSTTALAGDTAIPNSPDDIGAATAAQGALADSALQPPDVGTAAALDVPAAGDATVGEVVKGDDSRLTNSRTPTAHASTHAAAGSDPVTLAQSQVTGLATDLAGKVPTTRTISAGTGLTGGGDLSANRSLAVSYGTAAGTAAQGNDSRLSDARTPTAHAASHASGGTDAVALDASQVTRTTNAQTGTTYTLVLGDATKFVSLTNAAAITLTVPPNSSVAFPVGTEIILAQLGAGQVTISPGAGVTLNATPGLKVAAQYGTAALKKTATDTWLVFGRLAA